MADDFKIIGSIEDVGVFDSKGFGPGFDKLQVSANVHPSPNYPLARILFGTFNGQGQAITCEQAEQLIELLQQAIAAVPEAVRRG